MNYKQMLLLDVLINQSDSTRRRYLIFRMKQSIGMGKFYKKKDLDGLVDVKRLYKDYVTFFNNDSDAVRELFKDNQMIIDLDEDAENNVELKNVLLDDVMIYHMGTFTKTIDVMEYMKSDYFSNVIYNVSINDEKYTEFVVEEGTEFTPLMMTEKK